MTEPQGQFLFLVCRLAIKIKGQEQRDVLGDPAIKVAVHHVWTALLAWHKAEDSLFQRAFLFCLCLTCLEYGSSQTYVTTHESCSFVCPYDN